MNTLMTRAIQALMVAVLIGAATFAMMRALPGDAAYRVEMARQDERWYVAGHRPAGD